MSLRHAGCALVWGVLLSVIAAQAEDAIQHEAFPDSQQAYLDKQEPILERLQLNSSQRAAIQSVLLGGMQSLRAVSDQLNQLQIEEVSSKDSEMMLIELQQQKIKLAESIAYEILSILTPEQISRLNIPKFQGNQPNEIEAIKREFEI